MGLTSEVWSVSFGLCEGDKTNKKGFDQQNGTGQKNKTKQQGQSFLLTITWAEVNNAVHTCAQGHLYVLHFTTTWHQTGISKGNVGFFLLIIFGLTTDRETD